MKSIIIALMFLFWVLSTTAQYGIGQDENPSKGQENANKGQYEESNNIKEHPYTIFVKTKDNFNILSEIQNIEAIINDPNNRLRLYYKDKIYPSAATPFDPDDTFQIGGHIQYTTWEIIKGVNTEKDKDLRKGVSASSKMCKNAAFVYLIGIDTNGVTLRRSTHPDTIAIYNGFKTRAIERLQYMNVTTGMGYNVNSHQWHSKELIHYLLA